MIDPFTAYAAYSTGKKWLPYAVGGGLGLALGVVIAVGAWKWQEREIVSLTGQLTAMTDQRDLAANDARRWEAFGETARVAVDLRNAEVDAQRADLAATELLLEQATAAAERESATLNAQIKAMKDKAHANPDQVRPLGPIARDAGKLLKP